MRRKRIRRVTRVATWEFYYTENGIDIPAGELTCKKPAQTKLCKAIKTKFHTNPNVTGYGFSIKETIV
jgi:hypothetical protein